MNNVTWHFTTTCHGTSSTDGTGGTVNEMCDIAVSHKKDIVSVEDVIEVGSAAGKGKIKMFSVTKYNSKKVGVLNPINPKAIPNNQ